MARPAKRDPEPAAVQGPRAGPRAGRPRRHWLFKSEPGVFSYQDLERAPRRRAGWDGVRNYQARNLLRDEVREGDLGLFYHSSADPPGVAGIVRIVGAAEADPTQFDPRAEGYDARSRREAPTWLQVVVEAVRALPSFVPLEALRAQKALAGLPLLRRGQRLSIQPVGEKEWRCILALGGLEADPD